MPCILQGVAGDGKRDPAVGLALGVIANPAQAVVGQPGRAAAASGDFLGRGIDDLHPQFLGVAPDDLGQFLDRVEIQSARACENGREAGPRAGRCAWWRRSA